MTRVLIVASSAVVRAGLASILGQRSSIDLAGSTSTLSGLVDRIETLAPDVVLVDFSISDNPVDGTLPHLEAGTDGPALVVLAANPNGETISHALRHGARAVLPRDARAEEIIAAVDAAALGLVVLPAESAALLALPSAPSRTAPQPGVETLTPRELEVLTMLAEGMGNKQIARRLGISEHTVKFHVGSILAKLGAGSRTEAVTTGVRQGLIMV